MSTPSISRPRLAALGALVTLAAGALAGCGGDAKPGAIPWIDEPAQASATTAGSSAPACDPGRLTTPANGQKWGGVWRDQVAGFVTLVNSSGSSCELAPPRRVTALTAAGPVGFGAPAPASESVLLQPGGSAQVQVGSPYSCGKAEQDSRSFRISFDNGHLVVPGATMAVQCGGSVTAFAGGPGSGEVVVPQSRLQADLQALPSSTSAGDDLAFQVRLHNPTGRAVRLQDSCPSYEVGLKGQPGATRRYLLNCRALAAIPAGATRTFQMRLPLPAGAHRGAGYLNWHLLVPSDGGNTEQYASAPVTVD